MTEIDDRDLDVLPAEGRCLSALRPNTAPAYYLGRPARLWLTVMRPLSLPPPRQADLKVTPITGPSSLARQGAGA